MLFSQTETKKRTERLPCLRDKPSPGEVIPIPTASIRPTPHQPRRTFAPEHIASLADSIRRYGLLQPLTVRRTAEEGQYELIAGERRLRAVLLLGREEVPCLVLEADEKTAAALAILENLQRRDLTMFEQAAAFATLLREYSLTQEEVARQLSVSQSYVANKLRLLRFLPDEQEMILDAALTERHARALLRLTGDERIAAIRRVIADEKNVADTEAYVEQLLTAERSESGGTDTPRIRIKPPILRDVRLFCHSVNRALDIMRQAGVHAEAEQREEGGVTEIVIRIGG